MDLQSLILSLSSSPASTAICIPASDGAAVRQAKAATEQDIQAKAAAPKQAVPSKNVDKSSVSEEGVAKGSGASPLAVQPFLKKGANSLRQKQLRFEMATHPKVAEAFAALPSQSSTSSVRYQPSPKSFPRFAVSSATPAQSSPELALSPVSDVSDAHLPYPPNAHPRLLLLLPELCFDRSPLAAQRVVGSWLDDSTRSRSLRLVCLCEMHIARPHGPSSSPLILWHRCSHQGFPVAAAKGAFPLIQLCIATSCWSSFT